MNEYNYKEKSHRDSARILFWAVILLIVVLTGRLVWVAITFIL